MTVVNYVDTSLGSAIAAAGTQVQECTLAINAFASGVTVKLYSSGGTYLGLVTLAAFTMTSTTPRRLVNGAFQAFTFVATGTATEARLFDGATERWRCPITLGAIKSGCSPDLTSFPLFSANAGKPVGAASSDGVANTGFTALLVPPSVDYELRQPVQSFDAIVAAVPGTGTLYHSADVPVTIGMTLTPTQLKSVYYRAGAGLGSAGTFTYTIGATSNSVAITVSDWQAMCGVRSATFRIHSAASGGTTLFTSTVAFNVVPSDPLGAFKRGPLASTVEGIGYQYCAMTPAITVSGTGAKDGFVVRGYRWYTPSNGTIETRWEVWPNAAGYFPFRTAPTWSPANDVRQLVNVEIDLLDSGGSVYTVGGERSGQMRGTTNGSDQTRMTLTAATGAWWWNKTPTIINYSNNPRLIYPHRLASNVDTLSLYTNSNANGMEGTKPNVFYDAKYPGWGYTTPGYSGSLSKRESAGGQTHDRQPYHEAESAVLCWGPTATRRYTANGSFNYGEMMLHVADCAANGMPVIWTTEAGAAPFDPARYPSSWANMCLTDASPDGAIAFYQYEAGISPKPPSGVFSLASNTVNDWEIDRAHFYTACGAAYAMTGCVRYFQVMQHGPIAALLTYSPGYRTGLVPDGTQVNAYYRSFVKPVLELYKAYQFSPDYSDGMWLSKSRLKEIFDGCWASADNQMALEESASDAATVATYLFGVKAEGYKYAPNQYTEGVGPSGYESAQNSWPGKPAGSVVMGWHHETWDVGYITPLLLMMKKDGNITSTQTRYIRKLARFVQGVGAYCQEGAERHPFVAIDRCTMVGGSTFTDYTAYDNADIWSSAAVPTVGATLGSAALGGVAYTSWDQIRARRGESNRAATGYVSQNASRNFAFYIYWEFAEAFTREFPTIAASSEFADMPSALAYYRRSMDKIKTAMQTCISVYNAGSDPYYYLPARPDLATGDSQVNRLQGAYFLQYGQMYLSTVPTLASPKVWQVSGVDA